MSPDVGADKYLNMGQLHEGKEALNYYTKALKIMKGDKVAAAVRERVRAHGDDTMSEMNS